MITFLIAAACSLTIVTCIAILVFGFIIAKKINALSKSSQTIMSLFGMNGTDKKQILNG